MSAMNHFLNGKAAVGTRPRRSLDLPGTDSDSAAAPRSRMKVLIAHCDPLISAGLAVSLRERDDFETLVCSRELTASRAMGARLPPADVVIADYDSGLELLASEEAATHRVIILTHSDSEAKISHALKQGACGYLMLGCSLQELVDSLRSVHVGGISLGPLAVRRIGDWMKQPTLTRREADVLRQMMLGLSNKSIATNLTVRVGTVKTHVKAIFNKLDALNRTEAVTIAQRRGILREEHDCLPPEVNAVRIAPRSPFASSRGEFTDHDIGNDRVIQIRAARSRSGRQ
jgi:two-component system NarL family response regulator